MINFRKAPYIAIIIIHYVRKEQFSVFMQSNIFNGHLRLTIKLKSRYIVREFQFGLWCDCWADFALDKIKLKIIFTRRGRLFWIQWVKYNWKPGINVFPVWCRLPVRLQQYIEATLFYIFNQWGFQFTRKRVKLSYLFLRFHLIHLVRYILMIKSIR